MVVGQITSEWAWMYRYTLHLQPGEHAIVRVNRGVRWVTQVIYASKSWAVAVKVVNISQSRLWLSTGTFVARIAKYGYFTRAGRFVRPGRQRYKEWQQLIYENTKLIEKQRYERKLAELEESLQPPCVQVPEYQ
ncbi:Aspartic protease [Phytophthora megakarya]|uniref:Aspartic protease n=1 Tax=Phytophthora megakarya TaxID=4795 RepID=A0A225W962_9STRA|nr:Aspartic protease [Phytophthora megakarya]